MLPIVFTKKLDKMESINTNWEPLSFKKITTMLLEESKPEYNPRNISSTSTVRDMTSYNKLEDKLKTYFHNTASQFKELNLKRIIEMALDNIKKSSDNQNLRNEFSESPIKVKNEPESWSSDDDEVLVSVKRRKIDTPKDLDNLSPIRTETKVPDRIRTATKGTNKPQKNTKTIADLLVEVPVKNINKQRQFKSTKVQVKKTKDTTTVAEVQSQLKKTMKLAPIRNSRTIARIEIEKRLSKIQKGKKLSKDVDNENQKKNQSRPNENTNVVKDKITNKVENQSQTKTPDEQNENESPVLLTNTINTVKKKRLQDIGLMSIYFFNTGLMEKQLKVTEERYDIGKDGNLEKFFVQSRTPKDFRRFAIQKTVCCLYKRAQVITEILDEYEISPTAVNFLRSAHLCEVGACLCCCKPNRSAAAQSDAVLTSRILENQKNTLSSPNAPLASSSDSSLQHRNLYATDKITKNLLKHNYKLSIALKGLVTSLLTNFKGITLTAGSTGKLSAVFNTTFTSWNNTDVQLITTILSKMRKELSVSRIPSNAFCECVNSALNTDNLYSQASTLLGAKQLQMVKQYSLAYFQVEGQKVPDTEDPKIEYFRGDPKLLQASSIPGPSGLLNQEITRRNRRTIKNDKGKKGELRKITKRGTKKGTNRDLKNETPEALRECVFVPESIPDEPTATANYSKTVPIKNPILNQMLTTSGSQSTSPEKFVVTQMPLQYLVSVPVAEKDSEVPHNGSPKTENILTIDLSSDEESILP